MKSRQAEEGVDPVVEAAVGWFVRLHDDPADPTLRPAFEAWRDADPRHARAYERLQRLWGASAHLPSLAQPALEPDRRRVLRAVVGAGGVGAAALLGGRLALEAHPFADHRTQPGETARLALADGSLVELSTSSALEVDLDDHRRRLRLLAGEAWFSVTPGDPRPFIVEAAEGRVGALDGAFAVAIERAGVFVSVTAGAARVGLRGAAVRLAQGVSVAYDGRRLGDPRPSDPDQLAWREGKLVLVNRPLAEVASRLDRWTGGRTLILDSELAARRVTLITDTDDAAQGLDRLAPAARIRLWRGAPWLTAVTKI
ncbi:FecR family protein [Caulobacter mirabilis]|uniref:Iron dicitrate transport regulator FecR n=1 Tax=Caulobacter mirabilis TaxID=69666 RepID=A0A2D2AYD9_9CAUL|nr:FecR domain-containing protein [Caulobacter mirabilis]ATQ42957.1 hypothetical protein CSW64_11325 [Caulobacter mirabilis]